MSGGILNMRATCRKCLKPLTLDEMHYLDCGDGTATCNDCESVWADAMGAWRNSKNDEPMPERP